MSCCPHPEHATCIILEIPGVLVAALCAIHHMQQKLAFEGTKTTGTDSKYGSMGRYLCREGLSQLVDAEGTPEY